MAQLQDEAAKKIEEMVTPVRIELQENYSSFGTERPPA